MNYLGHIYLSGKPSELMIGNFIADFVKGKQVLQYSPKIQKGILLHRKIDAYTDQHPIVREAAELLKPKHGRYAPIIMDVFYDYLLAKNWDKHHTRSLLQFSEEVYVYFKKNSSLFPPQVQGFLPNMEQNNWLLNYGTLYGMKKSLEGLSRRAKYAHQLSDAVADLETHYEFFNKTFPFFITDMIGFVKQEKLKL